MAAINAINGDRIRAACTFYHVGEAYSTAKLYFAIYDRFTTLEKQFADLVVPPIPVHSEWTKMGPYNLDIIINNVGTTGYPSTFYQLYVKLMGIPGGDIFVWSPEDFIFLGTGVAEFLTLEVTFSKL